MSVVSDLLAAIKSAATAQSADREQAYWQLVRDSAAGTATMPPERAAVVISDYGRSAQDFERDVEKMTKRFEFKAMHSRLPEIEHEQAEVAFAIDEANEKFRKAKERWESAFVPLHQRQRELATMSNQASDALAKLAESCPYPWLIERRKALAAELKLAERAAAKADEVLSRVRANAKLDVGLPDHPVISNVIQHDPERVTIRNTARERLPRVQKERDQAHEEVQRIMRAIEAVEVEMQTP